MMMRFTGVSEGKPLGNCCTGVLSTIDTDELLSWTLLIIEIYLLQIFNFAFLILEHSYAFFLSCWYFHKIILFKFKVCCVLKNLIFTAKSKSEVFWRNGISEKKIAKDLHYRRSWAYSLLPLQLTLLWSSLRPRNLNWSHPPWPPRHEGCTQWHYLRAGG